MGVRFGGFRILSLLFADDVVLSTSHMRPAKCQVAGMKTSTSTSEAMVLAQKRVDCPLQVGEDRKGAACKSANAMLFCCGENRAVSEGVAHNLLARLHPNPHPGSQAVVVTKAMKLQIQTAEMSFFCTVARLGLSEVRSSEIRETGSDCSQLRFFRNLVRMGFPAEAAAPTN